MRYLSCDLQYLWYWKINRLRKLAPEPMLQQCSPLHQQPWMKCMSNAFLAALKPQRKTFRQSHHCQWWKDAALHCGTRTAAPHKNLCKIHAKHLYNKYQPRHATKKSWPKARIHAHSCKKIPFPSLAGLTVIAKQAVLLAPDHRSTTPSQIAPVT